MRKLLEKFWYNYKELKVWLFVENGLKMDIVGAIIAQLEFVLNVEGVKNVMSLTKVTITGADDTTNILDMEKVRKVLELTAPFIEK